MNPARRELGEHVRHARVGAISITLVSLASLAGCSDSPARAPARSAAPSTARSAAASTARVAGERRLASGEDFVCFLDDSKHVRCWGKTLGAAAPGTAPEVVTIDGLSGAVEIAAGAKLVCGRLPDATVRCTRQQDRGFGPAQRIQGVRGAMEVAVDQWQGSVLRADGSVVCFRDWGQSFGFAKPVSGLPHLEHLASSATGTTATGDAYSWGAETLRGELFAHDVRSLGFRGCLLSRAGELVCGETMTEERCVISADGQEHCTRSEPPPAKRAPARGMSRLVASQGITCAIGDDASLRCWGDNADGQLGDGTRTERRIWPADVCVPDDATLGERCTPPPGVPPAPLPPPVLHDVVEASVSQWHACALRRDGSLFCWGQPWAARAPSRVDGPTEVSGISDAIAVRISLRLACALRRNGRVACWGADDWRPTWLDRDEPFDVPGIEGARAIAVGADWLCALDGAGHVRCIGGSDRGTVVERTDVPVATALTGDWHYACALAQGVPHCWGAMLGAMAHATATPVSDVRDAIAIGAGEARSCALDAGGTIRCWGARPQQDWDDEPARPDRPAWTLGTVAGAVALSVGDRRACARTATEVYCAWESGYTTRPDQLRPIPIPELAGAEQVSTYRATTCGLRRGQWLRCISLGNSASVEPPPSIVDALDFAIDNDRGCIVRNNGHVLCWGDGARGDVVVEHARTPRRVALDRSVGVH